MTIAVCDDNPTDLKWLVCCLQHELSVRRLACEIAAFTNGEALLTATQKRLFSICFLDIFLSGIDGIAIAKYLRTQNPQAALVFTTNSPDFMADGFEVGVMHYLIKPFHDKSVGEALERCLRMTGKAEPYVEITVNREPRRLLLCDIISAEAQDKNCVIRLKGDELRPYLSLETLHRRMHDTRFFRCHRSYLVNLDYVAFIRNGEFQMTDGTKIPIRREDRHAAKKLFENFVFSKVRKLG